MTASNTITVLNNDIVCGRGRGFEIFPGNQTFRRIIYENATSYAGHLENRSEKSILIKLIASKISENNMRFVKRAKRGWSLLGENEVKLKIGHALRDVAPLQRKSDKRNHKKKTQNGEIEGTTCSQNNKYVSQVSFTIFIDASNVLADATYSENQETSHEKFDLFPPQAEPSEHILPDTASSTHSTTNEST